MKQLDMWDAFSRTGKVEDYLRYRGVDAIDAESREGKRRYDNRRSDHPGKQQYR